jgi:hypothetical protein
VALTHESRLYRPNPLSSSTTSFRVRWEDLSEPLSIRRVGLVTYPSLHFILTVPHYSRCCQISCTKLHSGALLFSLFLLLRLLSSRADLLRTRLLLRWLVRRPSTTGRSLLSSSSPARKALERSIQAFCRKFSGSPREAVCCCWLSSLLLASSASSWDPPTCNAELSAQNGAEQPFDCEEKRRQNW